MNLICIKCPRGCNLNIDGEKITGNLCPRGIDYAKEELTTPMRTVTSLIKTKDGIVPVKTSREVPKEKIFDVLEEISKINVSNAKIGDVILKNVLNLDADIIVTGNVYKTDN